jgi:HD-GYP domain-containing protein (c-di-GMP phosphodiesterase class II)
MAEKIILAVKEQVLRDLIIFTIQSEMYFNIIEVDDPVNLNVALMKNPDTVSVIYDDIFGVTGRKAVVDYMRDNRLEVPLYLLGKQNIEVMVPGIDGMHEVKPIKGDYLEVIMEGVKEYFEEDTSSRKREYVPITFRTLTRLKGLTEDVFIRLSEKKFLKIYKQQDKITFNDVEKYAKKGVDTLYLDKETSKWLLKQLSKFVEKSIEKGSFDDEVQVSTKANIEVEEDYDGVLNETQRRAVESIEDIDPNFIESLSKRIDHAKNLASKSTEIEKMLKALAVNRDTKNYFNTHNNLLSTIVCVIARKCEWYQDATLEKLVFAAQMHDLPLVEDPELAKINDPKIFENSKFALEEYQVDLVQNHATKMAELVKQLPTCPMDADKIIALHHELPNKTGWPNGLGAGRIIPLASLFIISHDLVDYIIDNPDWTFAKYNKKVKTKFLGGSFKKILDRLK